MQNPVGLLRWLRNTPIVASVSLKSVSPNCSHIRQLGIFWRRLCVSIFTSKLHDIGRSMKDKSNTTRNWKRLLESFQIEGNTLREKKDSRTACCVANPEFSNVRSRNGRKMAMKESSFSNLLIQPVNSRLCATRTSKSPNNIKKLFRQ